MVNMLVENATSSMLIGPDWAMNMEICELLNRDPGQAKDVVKGIKKRLGSKNPNVQLLTLTLLDTLIKNCGDIAHTYVVERGLLQEMVKIAKKKPNFQVKEKILILIDTWQEGFGRGGTKYPQYYAAYQELLKAGMVFPRRPETSAPVLTPPQTQPLSSHPQYIRNLETREDVAESSAHAEFPALSLTEIQNARGVMDVLADMLNAIEPGNKEGLSQEVVVDLVEQCRNYKERVVQLVNSTSDESLLCQGLALNDDLQRLLSKHEQIILSPGTSMQAKLLKPDSSATKKDTDNPLIEKKETKERSKPPESSVTNESAPRTPVIDLLSGDDYSLALVPVGESNSTPPQSTEKALVLFDMFSDNNNNSNPFDAQAGNLSGRNDASTVNFQQHQQISQAPGVYANGNASNVERHRYGQSLHNQNAIVALNGHNGQQQQPTPAYGIQNGSSLPPPPWEVRPAESNQVIGTQYPPPMQVTQVLVTHSHPVQNGMYPQGPQPLVSGQMTGMYIPPNSVANQMFGPQPQPVQGGVFFGMVQPMQPGQMAYMYPQQMYGNQMAGYGYVQQVTPHMEQRMQSLSIRADNGLRNSSYQVSTSSYAPPTKPSKPEDDLFGELVNLAKVKTKITPGNVSISS